MSTQKLQEVLQGLLKQKDMRRLHRTLSTASNQMNIWRTVSHKVGMQATKCKALYFREIAPEVLRLEIMEATLQERELVFNEFKTSLVDAKKAVNRDRISLSGNVDRYCQALAKLH